MQHVFVQYPALSLPFNEDDFISALNNVHRTRKELDNLARKLLWMIPGDKRMRYFPCSYYLTAYSLSHILDRHYHKINRYPNKPKFTIPVPEIVELIRMGSEQQTEIIAEHGYRRTLYIGRSIGLSSNKQPCYSIVILTDWSGYIRSAYPI